MSDIDFPLLNASLNLTATLLLLTGYGLIKNGRERAHKCMMIAAFAASIIFLMCYVAYHYWPIGAMNTQFPGTGAAKLFYYLILITHVPLAMTVPVLALVTIWFGLRDKRQSHRRLAKWTFPIWLYVSITGVIIYLMLYQLYPQPEAILPR